MIKLMYDDNLYNYYNNNQLQRIATKLKVA